MLNTRTLAPQAATRGLPLLILGLASCQMPLMLQDPVGGMGYPGQAQEQRFPESRKPASEVYDEGLQESSAPVEDRLYAWDGGVVEARAPGDIEPSAHPSSRGLEPSLEGRMHILELYQEVLDERDALQQEVDVLRAALASAREHLDDLSQSAQRGGTRVSELELGQAALLEENRALLGRLATAQIRRLETEKLLLETQIAWHDEKTAQPSVAPRTAFSKVNNERP